MKKLLILLAILVGGTLSAQLAVTDYGTIKVENLDFQVTAWDKKWCSADQTNFTLPQQNRTLKKSDSGYSFTGEMVNFGKDRNLITAQYTKLKDRNGYHCIVNVEAPDTIGQIWLQTKLPLPAFRDVPIMFDDRNVAFKTPYNEANPGIATGTLKRFELPLKNGKLILLGRLRLCLKDIRRWNQNYWNLAILPTQGRDNRVKFEFEVLYERPESTPVDIRSVSNMGFADEIANDEKGGWTDAGSDNDFRTFPVGKQDFRGIGFQIIDPKTNGGKSCIVLRGPQMPKFPESVEIKLPKPVKGKYLYILHANSWEPPKGTLMGEVVCEYTDNQWVERQQQIFSIKSGIDTANFWNPRSLENAEIAWKGQNPSSPIGIYMTRFSLREQPLKQISIQSSGKAVWMIAGLAISDATTITDNTAPVICKAGPDYIPVSWKMPVKKDSILNLSYLQDAPAGKHGFLQRKGGHFEFENQPGKVVRFYGTNCHMDPFNPAPDKLLDFIADDIASLGYNMVRLVFDGYIYDNGAVRHGTAFDPARMDRTDYLIAALKKRGIYITFDLLMYRKIAPGDIPDAPDQTHIKKLMFISENARQNWYEHAKAILTHVNPYTGLALKDDPAVAMICLNNENVIFTNNPPALQSLFDAAFVQWQKDTKHSVKPVSRTQNPLLYKEFQMNQYSSMFATLKKQIRELGVKQPLSDMNFWATIPVSAMRRAHDYTDIHMYWAHPSFPKKPWSLPYIVPNVSACGRFAGGVSDLFGGRLFGIPFTSSEWQYCQPNNYCAEGPFLVGAYAALQDWSGLLSWAYTHGYRSLESSTNSFGNYFDIVHDPLRRLANIAGVLFFLRRDVAPAKETYPLVLSNSYPLQKGGANGIPPIIRRLGLIGKTGILFLDPKNPVPLPEGSKAVFTLDPEIAKLKFDVPVIMANDFGKAKEAAFAKHVLPKDSYDDSRNVFKSANGEIQLDHENASLRVVTPKSEGFIVPDQKVITGEFASVRSEKGFAAVLVAAMDGKQLTNADRYLLLHLTDLKKTGMTFENSEMDIVTKGGKSPMLMKHGKIELSLLRRFEGFKLYALGADGSRIADLPLAPSNGAKTVIHLGTDCKGVAVSAYELIKQ